MGSKNEEASEEGANNSPSSPSSSSSSSPSSHDWKTRIVIPTLLAGVAGAGIGLISKHRKTLGLANVCSSYAANFAIVTGCYCGAREFVAATRKTGPDDIWNSGLAGFGTGALLGRLQGLVLPLSLLLRSCDFCQPLTMVVNWVQSGTLSSLLLWGQQQTLLI
ncbi:uncharacterized protein LOC106772976 isoform X2 [Vigna radiata var. radiata]|uniref:Uncharacterized protein LOC106772976 isoform X2 n=1 Tax=Vigna radiata var. radiata TaxID=3916 RepID=A0A3Q0FI04_VIGRR|nr:uncharacterized protein LOC106772976 isoform X2 [Vigna radiata var. radiata]